METEIQKPIENDLRAHHMQNFLYANLMAIHRGYSTGNPGNVIEEGSILHEELNKIPADMVAASKTAYKGYKEDTIGFNSENAVNYHGGIKQLIENIYTSRSNITVGNLRDVICSACLIGSHCLTHDSQTSSKDGNMLLFFKRVLELSPDQQYTYNEKEVHINNQFFTHKTLDVTAAFVRSTSYHLARYFYAQIEDYVERTNYFLQQLGEANLETVDNLFVDRYNAGLTPNAVIFDFFVDESRREETVVKYLEFLVRSSEDLK